MHFDFTVSLGNLLTVIALLGLLIRVERLARLFMVEHEILIEWYCRVHGITRTELPTRSSRGR